MDSSLYKVWQDSANDLFLPSVSKGNQGLVAFFLLLVGVSSTGLFALSMS